MPDAGRRTYLLVPAIVATLLILGGIFVGLVPVNGFYDSESFHCGSPITGANNEEGYGGTEQYRACNRERRHLGYYAAGGPLLGVVLLGSTALLARELSRDDDSR
jgi:hypothetical protein